MSLAPKEIKNAKRVAQMGTGTHCAMIADLFYLQNAAKQDILANGKYKIMVVRFENAENKIHEQHYTIDGAWRQAMLKKLFSTAQVIPTVPGKQTKKDAIGKRVWISIREIHYMDDGLVVLDLDGNAKIDYQIFQIAPVINGGKKPAIVGDPADNDGTPMEPFIGYKNVSMPEPHHEEARQQQEPKQSAIQPANWDEEPTF